MKSTRKKAVKQVWSWRDDYALELAGNHNSELITLNINYSKLKSNVASERLLEHALMIRTELANRNAKAGCLLEGVSS